MRKHDKDRTIVLERKFTLFGGFVYVVEIFDHSVGEYFHTKKEHRNKFVAYKKALNDINKKLSLYEKEKNGLDGSVITINGVDYILTKIVND